MLRAELTSNSPYQTEQIAKVVGSYLNPGDVVTLEGGLGAGKTHFAKGTAKALGVQSVVNSPTFTIVKEYEGRVPLYHMDVYRLEAEELDELGLEEYIDGDGVCLIEWAEKIEDLLPAARLNVTIRHAGEMERKIIIRSESAAFESLLKELQEYENVSD